MKEIRKIRILDLWGRPLPHPTPSAAFGRALAGYGAQAPRCWDSNLGPLNFSAVVAPL